MRGQSSWSHLPSRNERVPNPGGNSIARSRRIGSFLPGSPKLSGKSFPKILWDIFHCLLEFSDMNKFLGQRSALQRCTSKDPRKLFRQGLWTEKVPTLLASVVDHLRLSHTLILIKSSSVLALRHVLRRATMTIWVCMCDDTFESARLTIPLLLPLRAE